MRKGAIRRFLKAEVWDFILYWSLQVSNGETRDLTRFFYSVFLFTASGKLNNLHCAVPNQLHIPLSKAGSFTFCRCWKEMFLKTLTMCSTNQVWLNFALSQACTCHLNSELLKRVCSPLCSCIDSYLGWSTLWQFISRNREIQRPYC